MAARPSARPAPAPVSVRRWAVAKADALRWARRNSSAAAALSAANMRKEEKCSEVVTALKPTTGTLRAASVPMTAKGAKAT